MAGQDTSTWIEEKVPNAVIQQWNESPEEEKQKLMCAYASSIQAELKIAVPYIFLPSILLNVSKNPALIISSAIRIVISSNVSRESFDIEYIRRQLCDAIHAV